MLLLKKGIKGDLYFKVIKNRAFWKVARVVNEYSVKIELL